MRSILILAAILLVAGGYAARLADKAVSAHPQQANAASASTGPREPVSSGRSLMVERERDGHFHIDSRINGRFVGVLVDTGASRVILRETDAANAGVRPRMSEYTAVVSTANGKVKAAPATLDRVELGGITVYDVPALILPDEVLATNLLGMSFLSRLRRYEVADGRLVLEQ
jgi:aspartyl protease family protein